MSFHVTRGSMVGEAIHLIEVKCNVDRSTAYAILLRAALDSWTDIGDVAVALTNGVPEHRSDVASETP